jgi:broad specificity phosphatase PhoE
VAKWTGMFVCCTTKDQLSNVLDLTLKIYPSSWFYDAPLSYLGLGQVEDLGKFLKKAPSKDAEGAIVAVLRADPDAPKSKILCSSLRRALSTMAAGFQDRLAQHPEEKILVVPSLQEISRNPDTLSITPAHTQVTASWIDKSSKLCNFQSIFSNQVDMSLHTGNKEITTNGLKRMDAFCDVVFRQNENHVIVGGHSIYFRSFFRTFMPYTEDHAAKSKKIVNCGVVALDLLKFKNEHGKTYYMIDPKTVNVVYGGF